MFEHEHCLTDEEIRLMRRTEMYMDEVDDARAEGYARGYKDACKYYDDKENKTPNEQV